jgi:hypothetical protein
LLRNVPPSLIGASAELHDEALRLVTEGLLRLPPNTLTSDVQKGMLTFPGRVGGCGVRLASRTAPAAFWAGWAAALPLLAKRFRGRVLQWGESADPPFSVWAFREVDAALRLEGADLPTWRELCDGKSPPELTEIPEAGEFRHGWQFYCSNARELHAKRLFFRRVGRTEAQHLWSQAGPGAAAFLTAKPDEARRFLPADFQIAMRRRLRLPILIAGSACPGSHRDGRAIPLDVYGDHLNSCTLTGGPQRRALPFERAWAQVFREAGINVRPKPYVRDLGLPAVLESDERRLDFLATGSTYQGGLPLACDPSLGSALDCKGNPHGGDLFGKVRRDKEGTYRDVKDSGRVALVVLAALTGGRFSEESTEVLRSLIRQKCEGAPPLLRGSIRQGFSQRWRELLSCAIQRASVACLQGFLPPVAGPFEVPDDFSIAEESREAPMFSRLGP